MQPILKINLSSGEFESIPIPLDWKKQFLGGASLAARMLYPYLTEDLDPLSPEAPILFINGPLSGTSGPTVGRFVICAKSPATGLWGESHCGGFWGPELRKTGFDGVLVTGKAETPVYLWIKDQKVEIRPAEHLWGQDTYQIQESIRAEVDESLARVAGIGIAGEKNIPYALVLTDHGRVAGRTGMGAVMGSKNLKAIAVRGTNKIPFENPEAYKKLRSKSNRFLRDDNVSHLLRELGTAAGADYFDYLGDMPKKYFQLGKLEGADKVSGASITELLLKGVSACHACVIACGRVVKLRNAKSTQKGPEYETVVGFGPNLMITDPEFITRMGDLCDRYGLDTISTSGVIALAFKLFEDRRLSLEDTEGVKLEWGNQDQVEKLIHQIANQEGFGARLSVGALEFARSIGHHQEAAQVHGLEMPYHDPRGTSGMAIVYPTSPRGACHNHSDYFMVDIGHVIAAIGMEFFPPRDGAKKAKNVKLHQDWRTMEYSLIQCQFGNIATQELVDLVSLAVDHEYSIMDLLEVGERGWNLKRLINLKMGLKRENETLPKVMLSPYQDDEEGIAIDQEAMLRAYYQVRDWDWDTGRPSDQKLESLGLMDI